MGALADYLAALRAEFEAAIEERGVSVPPGTPFKDLPGLIRSIPSSTGPVVDNVVSGGNQVVSNGDRVRVTRL